MLLALTQICHLLAADISISFTLRTQPPRRVRISSMMNLSLFLAYLMALVAIASPVLSHDVSKDIFQCTGKCFPRWLAVTAENLQKNLSAGN